MTVPKAARIIRTPDTDTCNGKREFKRESGGPRKSRTEPRFEHSEVQSGGAAEKGELGLRQ